jgi:hypothetical protein
MRTPCIGAIEIGRSHPCCGAVEFLAPFWRGALCDLALQSQPNAERRGLRNRRCGRIRSGALRRTSKSLAGLSCSSYLPVQPAAALPPPAVLASPGGDLDVWVGLTQPAREVLEEDAVGVHRVAAEVRRSPDRRRTRQDCTTVSAGPPVNVIVALSAGEAASSKMMSAIAGLVAWSRRAATVPRVDQVLTSAQRGRTRSSVRRRARWTWPRSRPGHAAGPDVWPRFSPRRRGSSDGSSGRREQTRRWGCRAGASSGRDGPRGRSGVAQPSQKSTGVYVAACTVATATTSCRSSSRPHAPSDGVGLTLGPGPVGRPRGQNGDSGPFLGRVAWHRPSITYERAAKCSRQSPSIAVASHACSAARTAGRCSSQRRNGAEWRRR